MSKMYYILDSNIWIDLEQGRLTCNNLTGRKTVKVVVAPFMIIELVRATVKGGEQYFLEKKPMFECMANLEILELTKVFMFKTLWNVDGGGVSRVRPAHYKLLIDLLIGSDSLAEFLTKTEAPGSIWKETANWDAIHEGVLEKELRALDKLARGASLKTLHMHMSRMYRLGGLEPDPAMVGVTFSAAIEFLRSSASKIRQGANPLKNDRGLYIDSQLFYYLADPEAVVVSNEDFSNEIKLSPQRNRIISYQQFQQL
jgi:hypothetical protein